MQSNERPAFSAMVTDAMAYYRQSITPFILDVWWDACQNVELEQVSTALRRHVMDPERGAFPPKVSDIVRALVGTHTDRAMIAWGKVMASLQDVGAYKDVVFDDAAIHAAVADCGGWVKMCRTETKELSYLQHRFCQAYKTYTEHGAGDYPKVLTGDRGPDSDYLKVGMKPPPPVVIGNVERARLVYTGGNVHARVGISIPSLLANG